MDGQTLEQLEDAIQRLEHELNREVIDPQSVPDIKGRYVSQPIALVRSTTDLHSTKNGVFKALVATITDQRYKPLRKRFRELAFRAQLLVQWHMPKSQVTLFSLISVK